PKTEDRRLRGSGRLLDRLVAPWRRVGRGAGCSVRRERLDVPPEVRGVPAPGRAVERMGARSDRLVRSPVPVGEVVAALVARSRPVADLVVPTARSLGPSAARGGV